MKNPNETIENRIRDLPACSAVPQPTASPGAHFVDGIPERSKMTVDKYIS
jgi:hypothetical protein